MKRELFFFIMALLPAMAWADVAIDETNFPDEKFRNWVLSQSYGKDGVLTDAEIAGIQRIDVYWKGIRSLKGIEFFTALKGLQCSYNPLMTLDVSKNTVLTSLECYDSQLTTLDLSQNTALEQLRCSGNPLTTLDLSQNTALTDLYCFGNKLTALDLSQNTGLKYLSCEDNQLTTLDVSKCTVLEYLLCDNNQLTTLDVSNNTKLIVLVCPDNQLTILDLSQNTELDYLNCCGNQLTTLDVSKNTELTGLACGANHLTTLDVSKNIWLETLYCYSNQIKGAGMDALVKSLPTVFGGWLYVSWYENEQNEMTTTQVAAAKAKGWFPLYFDGKEGMEYTGSVPDGISSPESSHEGKDTIYNLAGQRIGGMAKGLNIVDGRKVMVK